MIHIASSIFYFMLGVLTSLLVLTIIGIIAVFKGK